MKTITVETAVEINPDALHEAGWFHADELDEHECECEHEDDGELIPELMTPGAAVVSLHRQAHPSQPASVSLCREEPCRRLTLDQLRALPLTP